MILFNFLEPFNTIAYEFDILVDPDLPKIFSIDRHKGTVYLNCTTPEGVKCLDRDGTDGNNGHDNYTIHVMMKDNDGLGFFQINIINNILHK